MKLDPKEVEEGIDGLTLICSDGREQIKELFTKVFKVEFKLNKDLTWEVGEVWDLWIGKKKYYYEIVCIADDKYTFNSLREGDGRWDSEVHTREGMSKVLRKNDAEKIASSQKEYWAKL